MLINMIDAEESRIAIESNGTLEDLYVESAGREQVKGNIYKGVVVSIAKSLQACFVDFGGNRAGFLSIDEIDPRFYRAADGSRPGVGNGPRPPIQDVIRLKQELLVQVVKEEVGSKGASLTTYISLPGRYMVLMPGSTEVGISRKIEDEPSRKRLREVIDGFSIPEGIGVIVRTAATGKSKADLVKDFNYLRRLWSAIEEATAHCRAPALIYQERDIVTRAIRDHFSSDIGAIVVDNKEVFDRALEFLKTFLPRYQRCLQLYEDKKPLFSHHGIEEQIDTIYQHQVRLPSGGAIVIDPTEALVAVDVNSAKSTQERTAEETALRTNLEAAEEIARQLRLRDLGGIIVIDFIDMKDRKHNAALERCLKGALKRDKARINVGKVSKLGLVELSRQRLKPAIMDRNYLICPSCNGIGMVKSTEAKALILLRKLQSSAADGNLYMVRAHLPIDVYSYLLNKKREELARMEKECGVRFEFTLRTGFDEQVFNPDCLELFTKVPEESALIQRKVAAVRDSTILEGMRADEATGHDRVYSEDALPDDSDLPDFDPDAAEEAQPGTEPQLRPIQPPTRPAAQPAARQARGRREERSPRGRDRGRRDQPPQGGGGRHGEQGRGPRRPEPAQRPPARPPQRANQPEQGEGSTAQPPAAPQTQRPPQEFRPGGPPAAAGLDGAGAGRRRRRRGRGRGGRGLAENGPGAPEAAQRPSSSRPEGEEPDFGEQPTLFGGAEPLPQVAAMVSAPEPGRQQERGSDPAEPTLPGFEDWRTDGGPSDEGDEGDDGDESAAQEGERPEGQPAGEQGAPGTPNGRRRRRRRRGRGRRGGSGGGPAPSQA